MKQNKQNLDLDIMNNVAQAITHMHSASAYTQSDIRTDIEDHIEYTVDKTSVELSVVETQNVNKDREKAHGCISEALHRINEAKHIAEQKDDMDTTFTLTAILDGLDEIESILRNEIEIQQ